GQTQDRPHRCRTDRRHPRPPRGDQGAGRHHPLRHRRGHAPGQVARHRPVRPLRALRREPQGRELLRRHRGRGCLHRHGGRPPQAGHEPRRPPRHQPQGHEVRGRRHRRPRSQCLRHLHHQPARRDGLGAAGILGPAAPHGLRHGGRARQRPLPPLPGGGVRRLHEGCHRLRAGRPRRHDGPALPLLDRRGHPPPGPRQDGLDHPGEARRHRPAHPRRRSGDRGPPQDRLRLLRPRAIRDRDGRSLPQGPEARPALRRPCLGRLRPRRHVCGRPHCNRRRRHREGRGDPARRRGAGHVPEVRGRRARPRHRLQGYRRLARGL
ncbi:MAG: Malate dehydrogenase, partial [uncultured Rubellimicrobium sp.]